MLDHVIRNLDQVSAFWNFDFLQMLEIRLNHDRFDWFVRPNRFLNKVPPVKQILALLQTALLRIQF